MTTKFMLFDQDRCFGCNACVVACQQEYGLPAAIKFNRVDVIENMAAPINRDRLRMMPKLCNQCADPARGGQAPCQIICPVDAITRAAGGVIVTDRVRCVGCKLCTTIAGCPFEMRSIDGSGKAVKCDFCIDRGGDTPYCIKTCPSRARRMFTAVVPPAGRREPAIGKVVYGTIAIGAEAV